MFEFREPLFLLLAILAIPLFFWMRRPIGCIKFSSLNIWPMRVKSFRARTSFIPPLLLSLAFIAFCVALAGPRIPGGSIQQHREGISIMLVVDKSGSMVALDMSKKDENGNIIEEQDRLEALKDVLHDFIKGNGSTLKGRYNDSIGLVSFGTYPDSDCPLTLDHVTLLQLIDDVQIMTNNSESGTSMGDAIGLATERLRDAPGKSKVMILLTDGVNTTGYEDPLETARMAAEFGIKIYTVGIGTNGFAKVRARDLFGRQVMQRMPVELDENSLTEIANMTGGRYFRATDRDGLEKIYEEIDALEKTKISENRLTHYDEKYAIFIVMGLILAALGALLRMTYYRRSPM